MECVETLGAIILETRVLGKLEPQICEAGLTLIKDGTAKKAVALDVQYDFGRAFCGGEEVVGVGQAAARRGAQCPGAPLPPSGKVAGLPKGANRAGLSKNATLKGILYGGRQGWVLLSTRKVDKIELHSRCPARNAGATLVRMEAVISPVKKGRSHGQVR